MLHRISRLHSPKTRIRSTRFWIPSCHVALKGNHLVHHISFISSLAGIISDKSKQPNILIKNGGSLFDFKQFTITASKPSVAKYENVLSLIANKSGPASFGELPVVIVLATPSFATWLEDDAFMARLLDARLDSNPTNRLCPKVNALLAVVDRLPPVPNETPKGVFHNAEGFAIMFGEQDDCLPDLWHIVDEDLSNQHQLQSSSLMFMIHRNPVVGKIGIPQTVRVPLANTLFQNGRLSTLLVSSWQRPAASATFRKVQQIEKKFQEIRSPVLAPSPRIEIPLTYLTPLRQIDSGLGNVVRKLIGKDGKPVPASQELETSVDVYLKRDPHKQTLDVWALIIPKNDDRAHFDNALDSKTSPERKGNSKTTGIERLSLDNYVVHWLRKGASLHRVLSGGGGWGLKQGLISLDPESGTLKKGFVSGGSFEDDQATALGRIADPGSWIQFLAHYSPTHGKETESVPPAALLGSLVLGCIPSLSDSISQSASNQEVSAEDKTSGLVMRCFDGHFGALSEKGIYVYSEPGGEISANLDPTLQPINSKIDVPYTTFWWPIMTY